MNNMAHVWRSMAKQDCQNSINTICESIEAFPELLAWSDESEKIREHLSEVCELLYLARPWEKNNGS